MKKVFVCLAALVAMVLMVSCGGSDSGSSSGSESNNQECTPGDFECVGSESYYCNSQGSWVYDARCENGCDDSTGRCYSDSGDSSDSGNNNDHGDSSDSGSGNDNTDSGDSADSGNNNDHGDSADSGNNNDHGDSADSGSNNDPGNSSDSENCDGYNWPTGDKIENGERCSNLGEIKCIIYAGVEGPGHCTKYFTDCPIWQNTDLCFKSSCDPSTGKCKHCKKIGELSCGGDSNVVRCIATDKENAEDEYENVEKCKNGCDSSTAKCKPWKDPDSGLTWSSKSLNNMTQSDAVSYCNNLSEGGFSDWRLPSINELRTLIQGCPATQTGGECNPIDKCFDSGGMACDNLPSDLIGADRISCDFQKKIECNPNTLSTTKCEDVSCSKCEYKSSGYCKLDHYNIVSFWSSSTLTFTGMISSYMENSCTCGICDFQDAWDIDFRYANIGHSRITSKRYVRCVR